MRGYSLGRSDCGSRGYMHLNPKFNERLEDMSSNKAGASSNEHPIHS